MAHTRTGSPAHTSQQWLAHTTPPHVHPADMHRLDLVIYGATPLGGTLCCDATLVTEGRTCSAQLLHHALLRLWQRYAAVFVFFSFSASFSNRTTKSGPRNYFSAVLCGSRAWGAASACRQGPRAVRARPQRGYTRRQVGAQRGSRQKRGAAIANNQTNAQPTPTVPPAVTQQTRWRNGAALTGGARCFVAKPPTDSNRDDHQAAALARAVRLAPFASGSCVTGFPGLHVSPWLRLASPSDGADDGNVNSLLQARWRRFFFYTPLFPQSVPSPGPPCRPGRPKQLLRPRVPRPGLWLGRWSSVNPQGPHATRARCRLHGTPCAAAAPATMLQRLGVLRRKGCRSIVVPRRRGRRRAVQLAPLLRVRTPANGRTGLPHATSGHRPRS